MAKKPKRSTVVKKLDDRAREVFKEVYPKYCVTCGKGHEWFHPINNPYGLQVSHFIKRDCKQLRWDSRNIHPMCSSCNIAHNDNTIPYTKYMLKRYGMDTLDDLNRIRQEAKRAKPIPIDQLIEWYDKGMESLINGDNNE